MDSDMEWGRRRWSLTENMEALGEDNEIWGEPKEFSLLLYQPSTETRL